MDTKTDRRNFYQIKSYLNSKYHQEYIPERFSHDLQYLLDEFIPNATLKQLTKFMEKKFSRILKIYPEIEKPLKKVLKEKLNKMIQTIRKQQIQKILHFLKQTIPNIDFVEKQQQYHFKDINQKQYKENQPHKALLMENTVIKIPIDTFLISDLTKKQNPQKPFYKFTCTDRQNNCVRYFASTLVLVQQKFIVNKGNYQRQANNFLDKLVQFTKLAEAIENEKV